MLRTTDSESASSPDREEESRIFDYVPDTRERLREQVRREAAPQFTANWIAPFMILGRAVRDRHRLPGLRLTARSSEYIAWGVHTGCLMSLDVQGMVGRESMTATGCILCARCANDCPKDVIALRFARGS